VSALGMVVPYLFGSCIDSTAKFAKNAKEEIDNCTMTSCIAIGMTNFVELAARRFLGVLGG
jgi:hypothetical protein